MVRRYNMPRCKVLQTLRYNNWKIIDGEAPLAIDCGEEEYKPVGERPHKYNIFCGLRLYDHVDILRQELDHITGVPLLERVISSHEDTDGHGGDIDIDMLADNVRDIYLAQIFVIMQTNPEAPYKHKVSTNQQWLELADRMKQATDAGLRINPPTDMPDLK